MYYIATCIQSCLSMGVFLWCVSRIWTAELETLAQDDTPFHATAVVHTPKHQIRSAEFVFCDGFRSFVVTCPALNNVSHLALDSLTQVSMLIMVIHLDVVLVYAVTRHLHVAWCKRAYCLVHLWSNLIVRLTFLYNKWFAEGKTIVPIAEGMFAKILRTERQCTRYSIARLRGTFV